MSDGFYGPHHPPARKDAVSTLDPPRLYRQLGMTSGGKDVTREINDARYRYMKRRRSWKKR